MQASAPVWEVEYQADRRRHHHRCRCCNRVLIDGERALMVRVSWKKTYAIHLGCGDKQHGAAAWTWRDAFAHWGAAYRESKTLPLPALIDNMGRVA